MHLHRPIPQARPGRALLHNRLAPLQDPALGRARRKTVAPVVRAPRLRLPGQEAARERAALVRARQVAGRGGRGAHPQHVRGDRRLRRRRRLGHGDGEGGAGGGQRRGDRRGAAVMPQHEQAEL